LRIVASDGVTVRHAFGTSVVVAPVANDATRKLRADSPFVEGDATYAEIDDATDVTAVVVFEGATWADVEAALESARTAWRAEPTYYLDVVRQGVTRRYRTERPDDVTPDKPDLLNNRWVHQIRWHVQPNPSVTVA
jgi:hypothetical protein